MDYKLQLTVFDNFNNQVLTGFSNYVRAVNTENSATYNLVEDVNNPGLYYANAVPGGIYNIELDAQKNGNWAIKVSNYRHPVPIGDITGDKIANNAVGGQHIDPAAFDTVQFERNGTIYRIKQSFIDSIAAGGINPDGITIIINAQNQLEVKDGGITGAKIANGVIDAQKLTIEEDGKLFIGDANAGGVIVDYINTGSIYDGAVTLPKLAQDVINYINQNAGNPPDDITIGLNAQNQLEVKNNGVIGTKINIAGTFEGQQFEKQVLIPGFLEIIKLKQSFLNTISGIAFFADVVKFGADNTGAQSSSQAFQDAIDFLYNNHGGGILVIKPGNYTLKNVQLRKNISVLGVGNPVITYGGNDPTNSIPAGTLSGIFVFATPDDSEKSKLTYLKNITLIRNDGLDSCVNFINAVDQLIVENCTISNRHIYAKNIGSCAIDHCFFDNAIVDITQEKNEAYFTGLNTSNAYQLTNNRFLNSYFKISALQNYGCEAFLAENNYCEYTTSNNGGLFITEHIKKLITIKNNYYKADDLLSTQNEAIKVITTAANVIIKDNYVYNSKGPFNSCFGVNTSGDLIIDNNRFEKCGIFILQSKKIIFSNNYHSDMNLGSLKNYYQISPIDSKGELIFENNNIRIENGNNFLIVTTFATPATGDRQNIIFKGNKIYCNGQTFIDLLLGYTDDQVLTIKFNDNNIDSDCADFIKPTSHGAKFYFESNRIKSATAISTGLEAKFLNNYIDATPLIISGTAHVKNNDISGIETGTGLTFAASSNNCVAVFNVFRNVQTAITDQGTNNTALNNVIV
jgi:hypothetical protein